jgi:TPM domain
MRICTVVQRVIFRTTLASRHASRSPWNAVEVLGGSLASEVDAVTRCRVVTMGALLVHVAMTATMATGCSASRPPTAPTARAAELPPTDPKLVYGAAPADCYDAARALCQGPWHQVAAAGDSFAAMEQGPDKRYRMLVACGESEPVDDRARSLTGEGRIALASRLEQIDHVANVYMGVLIVPTLQGTTIEATAAKAFTDRQLGEHGILVIVAVQERASRIETGHAIEHVLTDDDASRILRTNLNPHLLQGDFARGLTETADAIRAVLARKSQR